MKIEQQKRLALFLGLLIVPCMSAFTSALWWSEHLRGAIHGFLFVFTFGLLLYLPLVILQTVIYFAWFKKGNVTRRRIIHSYSPSLVIAVFMLGSTIVEWPTAKRRFRHFVLSPIPASVTDIRAFYRGGVDYSAAICFRLSPDDFDAILKSKPFEPDMSWYDRPGPLNRLEPRKGWPDPRTWEEPEFYSWLPRDRTVTYHLCTNKKHDQIYFWALDY
jgi:hypothetical protein